MWSVFEPITVVFWVGGIHEKTGTLPLVGPLTTRALRLA